MENFKWFQLVSQLIQFSMIYRYTLEHGESQALLFQCSIV